MFWWSWKTPQRLALFSLVIAIAALPGLCIGWLGSDWKIFIGSCAFFAIPQVVAWTMYVGIATGIVPIRGGGISKEESPVQFWIAIGSCAAVLAAYLGCVAVVTKDVLRGL